jgi:hypothetical protein
VFILFILTLAGMLSTVMKDCRSGDGNGDDSSQADTTHHGKL